LESQLHQESHALRHELSELLLAKEDLERLTENLIKKVVMNDPANDTMSTSFNNAHGFTIESNRPKEVTGKKTSSEVLKGTTHDMREMSEVLRELSNLVG
jgi:hypothetical protein